MTAASFTRHRRPASLAAQGHPWKRRGGQARWGTCITAVAVAVLTACAMAWAGVLVPGIGAAGAGSGQVGPGATVAITAAHLSGIHGIYPGGTGDVVVSIANRNDVAVLVTAVDLPSSTTYATGYTTSTHTVLRTGCSSATSGVAWTRSVSGRSSLVPLATPLVIGAHQSATVTMTNGANMRISAPAVCEATYFAMPELIGIGARTDAHPRTSTPAVDSWVR
jgi:hypothetical protein